MILITPAKFSPPMFEQKDLDRFWSKVFKTRTIPAEDACWLWMGSCPELRGGYGQFKLNGKNPFAHRLSYEIACGEIPPGMFVCHTCDNRRCVRPSHLFLGTHQDNMTDCLNKDRYGSVLTIEQVIDARGRARAGEGIYSILKDYPVGVNNLTNAIRGKTFSHVPNSCEKINFQKFQKRKLTSQEVEEIMAALKTPYFGIGQVLAAKYGVTHTTITNIKYGRIHMVLTGIDALQV